MIGYILLGLFCLILGILIGINISLWMIAEILLEEEGGDIEWQ